MRDPMRELEGCSRCAAGWAARRSAVEAMHGRLTVWCGRLAGAAILVSGLRVLGGLWLA